MQGRGVVILGGKRTPIGTFMGGLSSFTAPHLGVVAMKGALESTHVAPTDVEEVFMGNVISAGSGQAPCRQVSLGSGFTKAPTTTVNKVCASGMKAAMMAT
jgi:acetyl-CoA C-acetyltransferase